MMSTHRKEIEYKYNADGIDLGKFKRFCQARKPIRASEAAGYDHFYSSDRESFCRHRQGSDLNQLTFKRKLTGSNVVRTEHNLDLLPTVSSDSVHDMCQALGYEYKNTIYKNNFVFEYGDYVLSYYLVYDSNLKELGRFMEIEAREGLPWESEQKALNCLQEVEEAAREQLGITPQRRVKRSLFEMFCN